MVYDPRSRFGTLDSVRPAFPPCKCVGDVAVEFVRLGPGMKSSDQLLASSFILLASLAGSHLVENPGRVRRKPLRRSDLIRTPSGGVTSHSRGPPGSFGRL